MRFRIINFIFISSSSGFSIG